MSTTNETAVTATRVPTETVDTVQKYAIATGRGHSTAATVRCAFDLAAQLIAERLVERMAKRLAAAEKVADNPAAHPEAVSKVVDGVIADLKQ